nr:hypothetical protein KK467_p1680 [Klebsiella pneumoniae]
MSFSFKCPSGLFNFIIPYKIHCARGYFLFQLCFCHKQ